MKLFNEFFVGKKGEMFQYSEYIFTRADDNIQIK